MYPGDSWWSHSQCTQWWDHNIPSGHMLGSFTMFFTMYPACPWATHWEFFQNLSRNVITMCSTTYSLSSLRIHGKNQLNWGYIVITLKEPPWGRCDHISGQFLKELSMSGSGTCWIHCEEHCERNHYVRHWGHCDHIDGHIVKELSMCPLGTVRATLPLQFLVLKSWSSGSRTIHTRDNPHKG